MPQGRACPTTPISGRARAGGHAHSEHQVQNREHPLSRRSYARLLGAEESLEEDAAAVEDEESGGGAARQRRRGLRAVWARATSSVSGEIDYVVVGEDPGQKADAASELEVETLKEAGS